ncbi:hypothetical protein LSH36_1556g00000, partial [Paralvinella palmiformis]
VYILLILAHLKSIQEIQVNHVAAINCHRFPIHPASSSRTIRSIRTASYRLSGNRRTESRSSSRSGTWRRCVPDRCRSTSTSLWQLQPGSWP